MYRVLKRKGHAFIYDLVKKMPKNVKKQINKDFGRFRIAILWLHSFEEPFYDVNEFEELVEKSPFKMIDTHFTGALCCMKLVK